MAKLPPQPTAVPIVGKDGRFTEPWTLWLAELVKAVETGAYGSTSAIDSFIWAAMLRGK